MAAIELYNRTKYSDEILYKALLRAKRIMGIKGDVAVKVLYNNKSTSWLGLMHPSRPNFRDLSSNLKRFANRRYLVRRGSYDLLSPAAHEDTMIPMATKDAQVGWIEVRVPKPSKNSNILSAVRAFETMIHEMRHVWQYRNREEALAISGAKSWNDYCGYGQGRRYRRMTHSKRPIEIDVRNKIAELKPGLDKNDLYNEVIVELVAEFSNEKVIEKVKKSKNSVKYNKYGQKISDYRNVKMNRLRSGEEVVKCPHCGEKSVRLDHTYDPETYTHVAAIDDEQIRWNGKTASEARYTQFGHTIEYDGTVYTIEFGYSVRKVTGDALKFFNENFYRA